MANGADIAQHIVRTPGVAGGSARIRDTRIPVWLVVHWSRLGWEPWRIRKEYEDSGVTDEDVLAALDYATAPPDEIARDLEEQDDDEDLA